MSDPSGNTEQFRAFANTGSPEQTSSSKIPLIVAGCLGVVVLVVLVVVALS